jgi:hypothetical protein
VGILIVVDIVLLAAALLLGLAAKLAVHLGVFALVVLMAAAIGSLWLRAGIAFSAYFGFVELSGQQRMGWAVSGALLTGRWCGWG